VLLVYSQASAKPRKHERSGLSSRIGKDHFALADSIGVPIDVAVYRDHRLKADATNAG
jgi:hypothetical protein